MWTLCSWVQMAHVIACKHLTSTAQKQKQDYDCKVHLKRYETGDLVWVISEKTQLNLTPKLRRPYEGPYLVLKQINDLIWFNLTMRARDSSLQPPQTLWRDCQIKMGACNQVTPETEVHVKPFTNPYPFVTANHGDPCSPWNGWVPLWAVTATLWVPQLWPQRKSKDDWGACIDLYTGNQSQNPCHQSP